MTTTPEPTSPKDTEPAAEPDEATSDEATSDEATSDEATSDEATSDEATSEKEASHEPTSDEDRQKSAEEFAAEHDPAKHDIAAGEEFRQPGDWTADDAGGPQVWDDEGNLVSEGGEATGADPDSADSDSAGSADAGGRRVSALEEVKDGGYSVGSAATLHDGAMPFGHPVKAWEDTKTYVTEDHAHYDDAEPHVWFTDAETAERAGFTPAE